MELWQQSLGYRLGRAYVDAAVWLSFSSIQTCGKENIPADGVVIFAANHTNTLMDALVVLQNNSGPISFGARADIFRNRKVARILHWMKIVPMARMRDGAAAVSKNGEVFSEVVECLLAGVPFTIYPEGTHRPVHSLQPLKKGVFRIALQAAESSNVPVYVVPLGIDYEDFFRFCRPLRMSYGSPIDVRKCLEEAGGDEAEAMRRMVQDLTERLRGLITIDEGFERDGVVSVDPRTGKRAYLYPLAALPALLCPLEWIPSLLLVRKLRDKAWSNTVRFGCMLLGLPLQLILNAIICFNVMSPLLAAAVCLATIVAYPTLHRVLNFIQK